MCGICGLLYKDRSQEVESRTLENMTAVLAHRGPDESCSKHWGHIAFGHQRLSIIDQEGGHQPMSDAEGKIWVTYNGEIYNYVELRSELIRRGFRFRTYSDTEVLIYLYKCYGMNMFSHINGMFSFGLYDITADRVLLARDRTGEKPMYYLDCAGYFAFASEIKSLLRVPGFKPEPDYDGIQEYLTFQYCLNSKTLFRNVHKLKPAHYLLLDGEGSVMQSGPYWTLEFNEDHTRNEEYYINELRFLLEDAVKIRLRGDVPVGTYLSGGLDSSLVASVSAKLMGGGLPAFSGYFAEDGKYSELPYASEVARFNGSEHFTVCPTAEDFRSNIHRIIYQMDEPAAGPGAFAQFMVSELASKHVKVVLGGQGGDEVFGGYARYLIMYLEECIKGSIFQTQDRKSHVVTMDGILPNLAMLKNYTPMLKRFWSDGLFEPEERRYFDLVKRIDEIERYFSSDFLSGRDEGRIFGAFRELFNEILTRITAPGSSLFNRMTAFDLKTMLQSLLHVEDRMSMAFSIESRLPLLDHRLIELVFRMPPLFKYRDGESKAILKAAARTIVPPVVLERKDKMGFPVPFVEWSNGPLREMVGDILLGNAAKSRGIYKLDGLERLIAKEMAFGRELWGLLCLELWFQTYMDSPGEIAAK